MGRNICLNGIGLNGWGGGRDNLAMLVEGISASEPPHHDDLSLLLPLGDASYGIRRCFVRALRDVLDGKALNAKGLLDETKDHIASSRNEETISIVRAIRPDIRAIYVRNAPSNIARAMRRHDLEVLLPLMNPPGKDFTEPWVGYIFDHQHRILPQFFSPQTIAYRDHNFHQMIDQARVIVVNSRAVRDETLRFYPRGKCTYVVLPFTPRTPTTWFGPEAIREVRERYGVPERYFLISNQFWVHKDHLTAFRALREAYERGPQMKEVHLVCTGATRDSRFPEHFTMLTKEIGSLGLRDRVHILGHIPKQDQLALLNGALAVVQPTLYEGGPGGGSVYDAMSYGAPTIVSDILINREIEEGDITFFEVSNPSRLADRMIEHLDRRYERPSREDLTELGRRRAARLHERLDEAVELAIAGH